MILAKEIRTYPEWHREFITLRRVWYIVGMVMMVVIGTIVGFMVGMHIR